MHILCILVRTINKKSIYNYDQQNVTEKSGIGKKVLGSKGWRLISLQHATNLKIRLLTGNYVMIRQAYVDCRVSGVCKMQVIKNPQ